MTWSFDTLISNKKQTFVLDLLLTLSNWQWSKVKIWSAFYQLKRALFVVNEVYRTNIYLAGMSNLCHFALSSITMHLSSSSSRLEDSNAPTNFPNVQGPLLKSLRFFISKIQVRGRIVIRITMICNEIVIVKGYKRVRAEHIENESRSQSIILSIVSFYLGVPIIHGSL